MRACVPVRHARACVCMCVCVCVCVRVVVVVVVVVFFCGGGGGVFLLFLALNFLFFSFLTGSRVFALYGGERLLSSLLADVMASAHFFLTQQSLSNSFQDVDILITLLAAAVHDVSHPGTTNQFQSVLYSVTFQIRISRDALVRFQSQKETNGSSDRPCHETSSHRSCPPRHSNASHTYACAPRTSVIGTTGYQLRVGRLVQ